MAMPADIARPLVITPTSKAVLRRRGGSTDGFFLAIIFSSPSQGVRN
jgi:hypothetical protein